MLTTPGALLLDFGGVIADGTPNPQWTVEMAAAVEALLVDNGVEPLPAEVVVAALVADDLAADTAWLAPEPRQDAAATHWGDVIGAGWPPPVRTVVTAHAAALARRMGECRYARNWLLRPGMEALVVDAAARGVPLAIVSNTICGELHREYLARTGLGVHFGAQLYSDEEGVRKPNPELVRRAAGALGVAPADCWFVGDTLSRDVLAARRAGAGAAILMRSTRVEGPAHLDGVTPDAVVADPIELHALLRRRWTTGS